MKFTAALFIAFICTAETKPPEPKPTTRVIVVAPVVRVPYRYYGYSLLGNLIGSGIVGAIEAHRARTEQTPGVVEVPYVTLYADPYVFTKITIESNPPGAHISINGQPMGETPQTRLQGPGSIYLLIRAEGYEDEIHEFRAGGAPVHIIADLKRHVSQ